MPSENGWNPSRANGATECQWVKIPGAEHVSLQFLKGWPLQVLRAYAADYHAYIEPLRDHDSAAYTATNSVATSNHLNGTAMDLNWQLHPFKVDYAGFDAAKIQRMRELLAFYTFEGLRIVFWAQDWRSPKDAMHHQMGYGTYGDQRVQRFIDQRIRPDGFSTYKRSGTAPAPVPPTTDAADVLARATGVTLEKAKAILPGVVNGLRDSQCTNVNRITMWLAQMGHESAGFKATEEYASGAAYEGRKDLGNTQTGDGVRFKGRTWIQITGRSNYTQLSKWAHSKGIIPTPTYFVDDSKKLAEMQYAGLGPAWYWTVARSDINALSDKRDLLTVTRRINGGTNGLPDRQARYDRATALGDQLLALTNSEPLDDLEALLMSDELFASRSIYRTSDQKTMSARDAIFGADACAHMNWVEQKALSGDVWAIGLVADLATGKLPASKDPWAVDRARHIISIIQKAIAEETK